MKTRFLFSVTLSLLPTQVFCNVNVAKTAETKKGIVLACEPHAANAGVEILRKGGNAADAYIATTLVEYVTARGYTSLSGPLYILYYDRKTKKSAYLNAGLNTISDPTGQWNPKIRTPGTSYVIGGAGQGLEALYKRFGSTLFSFGDLITPAVTLAKNGFKITDAYAKTIQLRRTDLKNSPTWNELFIKKGKPLSPGDILVQAALASTLEQLGSQGADYLFKGKFAERLVSTIRAQGGKLTLQDLAFYQTHWSDPIETKYREFKILSSSHRSFGGLQLLLSLKALENYKFPQPYADISANKSLFETLLRTHLFALEEIFPLTRFANHLESVSDLQNTLNGPASAKVWDKVSNIANSPSFLPQNGHHSCNPVIVDRAGNIATGVHTINAQPWGEFGLFVEGVSLNSAHSVTMDAPPGTRALDSINPVLVFQNENPVIAAGFFSAGLSQVALQALVNLLDYKMPPKAALEAPRFGAVTGYSPFTMFLDKRFSADWIEEFVKKGIRFSQSEKFIDTGMGMIIRIDPTTGIRQGSPTELVNEATVAVE